MRTCGGGIGV